MATHRCNHCDQVYDSQKPTTATILREQHASSDCPCCKGQAHQSRALMPHHLVADKFGRAIPDPSVRHIPALPMATEDHARVQELIAKLQSQLDEQAKRQEEIDRSMQRLAQMPNRPTLASAIVEPEPVGEKHFEVASRTVESTDALNAAIRSAQQRT